jgi:NADH:ubiquinone oxidoreductase subunit C
MLPDAVAQSIRDISASLGDILLLDTRRGRAIVSDGARIVDLCRLLKRAGFLQFVDFTGVESAPDVVTLMLTLRSPDADFSALILKWKWSDGAAAHPSLSAVWSGATVCEREIFEMLGVHFSGHPSLAPLLLDGSTRGNPLRSSFATAAVESYAQRLLRERYEQGLLDGIGAVSSGAVPGAGLIGGTEAAATEDTGDGARATESYEAAQP